MSSEDIRWKQRLNHYRKALLQLTKGVELSRLRPLSEIEQQGLIQAFEFTHELAWNVMKDFFEYQGNFTIMGSRDATREAFLRNLIVDGDEGGICGEEIVVEAQPRYFLDTFFIGTQFVIVGK